MAPGHLSPILGSYGAPTGPPARVSPAVVAVGVIPAISARRTTRPHAATPPGVAGPEAGPPKGATHTDATTRTGATVAPGGRARRRGSALIAWTCLGVGVAGALTALVLPRGPVTTAQSVLALLVGIAAGAAAGWFGTSRWLPLLGPLAFGAGYELARLPATGPTLDGVHLDTVYGVMAVLVGRGFDALVMGFPLAVAAVWAAAARRRAEGRPRRRTVGALLRRAGALLAAALVAVLLAALLRPASTAPVALPDGSPAPHGIAELVTVPVGGHDQSIMLRGTDRAAPVLLFLEGGPGGSAVGAMRASGGGLERDFVVAVWDQRGTGKSVAALEPVTTLTLEQMVQDTLAVTDYLRGRFARESIYLVGSSWGSTLGVLAAQRAPEKFAAFVGTGQMVDQAETDRRMYAESLAWAERTGRSDFARRLRESGPPPYEDLLKYPDALSTNEDYRNFPHGPDYNPAGAYPASFFVPEYTLTEQVRGMGALMDTFAVLYPQLQSVDFRRDVPTLAVPVFVVEGAYESPGRSVLAREWFDRLRAPGKTLVTFANSGHTPHLDEPGRFHRYVVDTVLAETGGPR